MAFEPSLRAHAQRVSVTLAACAMVVALFGPLPPPASAQAPTDAVRVVVGLKQAGLPIGDAMPLPAESDPSNLVGGRGGGYTSKVNFLDTRLDRAVTQAISPEDGGAVEVFASAEAAQRRRQVIGGVGQALSPLAEYLIVDGPVLLRLTKRLTPDQAAEYEAALTSVLHGPSDDTPPTTPEEPDSEPEP